MQINLSNIFQRYEEPHRFYHNKDHILRMLGTFQDDLRNDRYIHTVYHEKHIIEAILYHDIVYDIIPTMGTTNEEKSALFYRFDRFGSDILNGGDPHGEFVTKLILATQYHFTDNPIIEYLGKVHPWTFDGANYNNRYVPEVFSCQVLLDLDLQSFCDDYESFKKTNENIDKEYLTEFSAEAVATNRLKFLKSIQNSNGLQFSSYKDGKTRAEKARENLNRYIEEKENEMRM